MVISKGAVYNARQFFDGWIDKDSKLVLHTSLQTRLDLLIDLQIHCFGHFGFFFICVELLVNHKGAVMVQNQHIAEIVEEKIKARKLIRPRLRKIDQVKRPLSALFLRGSFLLHLRNDAFHT